MSQEMDILRALKKGRRITSLGAIKQFGCMRLASRVYDLRAKGYSIEMDWVESNGKRYSRYWIAQ